MRYFDAHLQFTLRVISFVSKFHEEPRSMQYTVNNLAPVNAKKKLLQFGMNDIHILYTKVRHFRLPKLIHCLPPLSIFIDIAHTSLCNNSLFITSPTSIASTPTRLPVT